MKATSPHSFHIPVMGLGFTLDTPIKVAKYGISSVVSIIEDQLIEQIREVICAREKIKFIRIAETEYDCKAKRITAYLNLLQFVVNRQLATIKDENFENDRDINLYFQLLPDSSELKKMYETLPSLSGQDKILRSNILKEHIVAGAIDVNIMTKVDKTNYDKDGHELPGEDSDALASLRGYAKSEVHSSVVFSAGLNPRLYSYCEKFDDFFPDRNGYINKQVILKVSDYRSALIQGKFLAKKGIWVSEFRIESGINCGGHAFIANGILLGPILEEFKAKRTELFEELFRDCSKALEQSQRFAFIEKPVQKITAQGGIGTADESNLLIEYFHIDSTGWGSPFLLVPEVTNVDKDTLDKLAQAKKEDYYLSDASPLGVLFNNFRLSSAEVQRKERIEKGRPGSPCYKKFLTFNKEFTDKPICTASRQYQKLKIDALKKSCTNESLLQIEIAKLTEKDCLCEGLGASALWANHLKPSHKLAAVTICPGPNLAFFSGVFTLKQMVDHIYGRASLLNNLNRPNFFVNELQLYVDYIKKELAKNMDELTAKKEAYFQTFKNNLVEGIQYYETLFSKILNSDTDFQKLNLQILRDVKESLHQFPVLQKA